MIRTLFYLIFFQKRDATLSLTQTTRQTGWTLLETMIVTIVLGLLSSLAISNLIGLMAQNKAQNALWQVKGTLREAQRNAIKMGKECRIWLKTESLPHSITIDSPTLHTGCLSSQEIVLQGVIMKENFPNTEKVRFSYKGNTTNIGTIVIESPNASTKYCLVVSNFLGIMRNGVYEPPANETSLSANSCKSSI